MNKLLEQKASDYADGQDLDMVGNMPWNAMNQAFLAGAKTALTMEWPADQYVPEKYVHDYSWTVIAQEHGFPLSEDPEECVFNFETKDWDFNGLKTWRLPLPVELPELKSEPTQLERLEKMAQDLAKQIQELKNNQ